MKNITFNMSTSHKFGPAFFDYLGLRKRFFVDTLGWDIPHDETVEMDQYDNPTAHYSVVLRDGVVVGGARSMPTTAAWGEHTYMLADAAAGKLSDIPSQVMRSKVKTSQIWECTRLVVSDSVCGHADRSLCLSLIVDGLMTVAARQGGRELISLSPVTLMRALRQLGYAAKQVGEPHKNFGDGRKYAVLSMPTIPVQEVVPLAA